jgi:hypothetical protein
MKRAKEIIVDEQSNEDINISKPVANKQIKW